MSRRIVGTLVVVAWLGMVGWQVRRAYFQPELAQLAEAAMALAPGVSFYTLSMGQRTVGQATSRLDTVPDGFVLEDVMVLELPALGQTGSAVVRSRVSLTPSLVMESFSFSLDSEVGRFEAEGELGADSTLHVTIRSQGTTQTLEFRVAQPPVFSAAVPIRVAMGGDLRVGSRVRLPVFDPSTLSTRTVEVHVLERETVIVPDSAALDPVSQRWEPARYDTIPAWKLAQLYGGVSVESWVDDDGRVLRSSSPLGFSMEKTEYELARQDVEQARLAGLAGGGAVDEDVILSTAVASDVDLGATTAWREIRFRLSGVDLEGFELEGGRQTLLGDTLVVRREDWDALEPGYRLPYKRMDLADALEPEPLIQSDDPRIIRHARSITAARADWSPDPRHVAAQLTRSVYGSLAKSVTFSIPSAVQVLETRRGDCNEHTALYVSLARAVGIPARIAAGLVWTSRGGDAFYYHAWPELRLGHPDVEWVPVDPTLGQFPADAAHIRFVVGGLAQQVDIVRLIGRLEIDVLETLPVEVAQ
ncbi:MAG: transglutaminase domain-containing protein [Gemmatimonadetes bacterium]|nr:transglutaminase domain-containing protein [Gemmatimonadota bacterium]